MLCAQTADWLITIEDVEASFVFYYLMDGAIGVSARSQGKVNVQLIMEAVGGGGHRTVAGAQLRDMDVETAKAMVLEAAKKHLAILKSQEEAQR